MIELNGISLRFGGRVVYDQLCVQIPTKGATAIFGASGTGKTTLLRMLLGLQKPDSGTIDGAEHIRFATVFQEDRLLPWRSALENVSLVSDETRARRYLSKLGLSDSMQLRPAALSGGMARRVAVARALAYGGDMLLLDEPFTGLDNQNKRVIADAIVREGMSLVVITHSEEEALLLGCDNRIMLSMPMPME